MTALRTSQVTPYRRFIVDFMIHALRAAFDDDYTRERQLTDLRITNHYPLQKIEYPAIVVEYSDKQVVNAGVAHEEWFQDEHDVLRKWEHRRFEGSIEWKIRGLSPVDRDLLADALVEVVSFGRLDTQLNKFFATIYGTDDDPVKLVFQQLMLNTDVLVGTGNSEVIAPWAPEDVLVFSTGYSSELHGGFYNTYPSEEWGLVKEVTVSPYPQGEQSVIIPFNAQPGETPTNPNVYGDDSTVKGRGLVTGEDTLN